MENKIKLLSDPEGHLLLNILPGADVDGALCSFRVPLPVPQHFDITLLFKRLFDRH